MNITISQDTRSALNVLGITNFPFSAEELNIRFKSACFTVHPDHGGTDESMRRVIEAKKLLIPYAIAEVSKVNGHQKKVDYPGIQVRDQKLFQVCEKCDGFGNIETIIHAHNPMDYVMFENGKCRACNGHGRKHVSCTHCVDGKFKLRSGRIVSCRTCAGEGMFSIKCNYCQGHGIKRNAVMQKTNHVCLHCRGTGEQDVTPDNPVLTPWGLR